MTDEEIVAAIKELLEPLCPDLGNYQLINGYQLTSIQKLVKHFRELGQAEEPVFVLSFIENIEVDALNSMKDFIRYELANGNIGVSDETKDTFEYGIKTATRLIANRVHYICD